MKNSFFWGSLILIIILTLKIGFARLQFLLPQVCNLTKNELFNWLINCLNFLRECICDTLSHTHVFYSFNLTTTQALNICVKYFIFTTSILSRNDLIFSWFFLCIRDIQFLRKTRLYLHLNSLIHTETIVLNS